MEDLLEACKKYFADEGETAAVVSFELLEESNGHTANVRISFLDDTVSDWKVYRDEDGTVFDAYCFNDVI